MCGRRTSKLAAFFLIALNLISMVLCIFLFAFSLWMIASPGTLVNSAQILGNSSFTVLLSNSASVQVGVTGTVVAGFIFFISAMGFYGAIIGSQFLLFMYATLVILLLLLECALMYYFSSNITEKGLRENDSVINHALRVTFRCCDQNMTSPDSIPWSCCDVTRPNNCTMDNTYKTDCKREYTSWYNKSQIVTYAALAVLHAILSSCSLVRRSYSASHSHT